jgi:transcription elongation factor GreA
MDNESKYLSKEGFINLKKELESLRKEARKEIAAKLEYAKSLGDLSENSEYQNAKDEQILNESRINQLENLLAKAVVVSGRRNDIVCVGSRVSLIKENNSKSEEYYIVGSEEVDPLNKKISNISPLGKSLINKKVGDTVLVSTPQGMVKYVIMKIC